MKKQSTAVLIEWVRNASQIGLFWWESASVAAAEAYAGIMAVWLAVRATVDTEGAAVFTDGRFSAVIFNEP